MNAGFPGEVCFLHKKMGNYSIPPLELHTPFVLLNMVTRTPLNSSEIITYYDQCQVDYSLIWQLDEALGMHYGYWTDNTPHLRSAIGQMNHEVARQAEIKPGMHVLDAGCGVGGSGIYLAKLGCTVEGISLSEKQINTCRNNASKQQVNGNINFSVQDYTRTSFKDGNFDVVWGMESVCYAIDKKEFTDEAFRLLKPGGVVVVADFFATHKALNSKDSRLLKNWTDTWAINSYATVPGFTNNLLESGFQEIRNSNITNHVEPSIRKLYLSFFPGWVSTVFGEKIGLRTKAQTRNTWSTYYQYHAHKRDLWTYQIYTARKPMP